MRSFWTNRFFGGAKHFACAGSLLAACAVPAMAANYQLIDRFNSDAGLGETALYLDEASVLPVADGRKVADLVSVNSYNRQVTIFSVQIDCAERAWRTMATTDYEIDHMIAPHMRATDTPTFAPAVAQSPGGEAIALVCGWPGSAQAARRTQANDAEALSQMIAPGLKRPDDAEVGIAR